MKKPINPFAAIARCLGLLQSVAPSLHGDQQAEFDEGIRLINESAAELQTYLDGDGPQLFGSTGSDASAFNRDGVDGVGGSLPDGWSLLDGGPKVVRDEDGLTLANAYVLRAVLIADPSGENVQVYDVAADEAFDLEAVSADIDPTWGVVVHYVGASAAVARTYDPDRKAPEPVVEPEPEPAPAPAPVPSDETPAGPESQPDWTGYDDDPAKWSPEQTQTFDEWFDGLPEGAAVEINHIGVVKAFKERRGDPAAPQEGGQDAQVEGAAATDTAASAETASTATAEAPVDTTKKKGK